MWGVVVIVASRPTRLSEGEVFLSTREVRPGGPLRGGKFHLMGFDGDFPAETIKGGAIDRLP